jgi:rare lipoprotein A
MKLDLGINTNIIFWLYLALTWTCFYSCRQKMTIHQAKNFSDSLAVFSDTSQYTAVLLKTGIASWYGDDWNGNLTHSGEKYNAGIYTAASATIPMGTLLKVTNTSNGLVVFVKVNDTFPAGNNRDIDLSKAAAQKIGMINEGVGKVRIEMIREKPVRY